MFKGSTRHFHILLSVLGVLFFIPFLGGVHLFDWDEINFAESAREMLLTGNFWQVQVNFEPFWEKPPLFFWLQALSMKLFGVHEFAARLPNALVGIVSLNILYRTGRKYASDATGRWWALVYMASITPQFYFHSGIIDPLFNLFIFLTVVHLYQTSLRDGLKTWLKAGILLGLAVLTKGPAAGLVVLLILLVMWVRNGYKLWFSFLNFLLFGIVTLTVASIWFLPEIIRNGFGFLSNFVAYQLDLMKNPVASHGQPWFYHPVVLLIGCFPASIVALRRFGKNSDSKSFEFWMKAMFWVVLILFSLVTTKIVHYSSLCYFPLTFLAAMRLREWHEGEDFKKWEKIVIGVFSVAWVVLFVAIPFIGYFRDSLMIVFENMIKDEFTLLNLRADAHWGIPHLIVGAVGLLIVAGLGEVFVGNRRLIAAKWLVFMAAYITLFAALIVPQVERHTQGEIIDFYTSLEHQDCYVDVYKFKSYAHYFYTRVKPLNPEDGLAKFRNDILKDLGVTSRIQLMEDQRKVYKHQEMDWLLNGTVDKPVYLVSQPRKAEELFKHRNFHFIGEFGGYFVFKRSPDNRISLSID